MSAPTPKQTITSDEREVFPVLMRLACWVFGISVVFEILSLRCLYGDGVHEFIKVLQAQNYVTFTGYRHFACYVFESPMLLAIKLGVTNLTWLQLAFGLGCFLPWAVTLALCYRLAPQHFWLAALACGAGYLNVSFVAVGEHIFAHAFFWPAVFALVFVRPLTAFAAAVLLISTTILLESYESMLFLGPLLAGVALWRGFGNNEKNWARCVYFIAAGLFIAAAIIALAAILKPSNGREMGGFKTEALYILIHPGWTIKWTVLWMCLMIAVCFSERFGQLAARPVSIAILMVAVCIWGAWPLIKPDDLNPSQQFSARFLDLAVPAALLPVAIALTVFQKWYATHRQRLVAFSAALLLAQTLWQICATWQWQGFVGIMRDVLASRTGYISLSGTPLMPGSVPGQSVHFVGGMFDWANPCLCIALSPQGHVQMMFHSAPDGYAARWQPFDPLDPKTFPDLQRYGVDYSDYISAISAPQPK